MAHQAQIENGVVVQVLVADTHEWCETHLGGKWVTTSYNTHGGVHKLGGTPLRKNYAGIGYAYDEVRDAFIPPKPFASWTLNEDTCLWEAPVAMPAEGGPFTWNETSQVWEEITI